jgi:hypothetical protein
MAPHLHFAGDANAARDAAFVERVRAAFGLSPDAPLELQRAEQNAQGEWTLEYAATQYVAVDGAEFGAANGVIVDERASVHLRFDTRGALVSSQVQLVDERHLQLVKDQIRKLAAADQIDPAPTNAPPRRAWYVETDARRRKRLKRASIA